MKNERFGRKIDIQVISCRLPAFHDHLLNDIKDWMTLMTTIYYSDDCQCVECQKHSKLNSQANEDETDSLTDHTDMWIRFELF